ncbi:glycoside hydrolase family 76 protein [Psychromicrobium sp. YIM B11713]|uniref:glycoside hydrolase family 76 protein n=1 Tax=Psychromicrobium sp. YIM B11713 TaxID=3145233 RepID=UPI00374E2AD0
MSSAEHWANRAASAAAAVNKRFGHRLLGLPGTWLGNISSPPRCGVEWHYWWQAHYLDCLVDSGWRELSHRSRPVEQPSEPSGEAVVELELTLKRIKAMPRSIRLRNFLRFSNSYFDDMAWLALAAERANELTQRVDGQALPQLRSLRKSLRAQLRSALSPDLGGGMFWSKQRDYKNTAINGPGALYFGRIGDQKRAQQVLDWMKHALWDPQRQLFIDGIHLRASGPEREENLWTYNQGPVLSALLSRPTAENLSIAEALIHGVKRGLLRDGALVLHGSGDLGLFTGILVRYLSLAASDAALPPASRETARQLVFATAEALWASRSTGGPLVFTRDSALNADQAYPPGTPIELSSQLQAWMIFEAAYRLASA